MVAYDKTPGWFNSNDFYFNKVIENNFDAIKKECLYLVENNLFVPHVQSEEREITSRQHVLAKEWNVFNLGAGGNFFNKAKELAPITSSLLESFPEIRNKKGKCYFSMVPGNAKVNPHTSGLSHYERYRHQLCIQTVDGSDAFIEVNGDRRTWSEGKVISFDDAFMHHVENNSDQLRIVLIYDTNRTAD